MKHRNVNSLAELKTELSILPDGTTCDILASDLEAGNFNVAHFALPAGSITREFAISYTGPVAEGYVSPFETGSEEAEYAG